MDLSTKGKYSILFYVLFFSRFEYSWESLLTGTERGYRMKAYYSHYENTPIQIYWKVYNKKKKKENFQIKKSDIFHIQILLKT